MPSETDARIWLRTIGYGWLADEIDKIMQSWKDRGLKTRRNWWEALAGTPKGSPMVVEGVTFPILAPVRERRGLDPVKGAIKLPSNVVVPPEVPQARWKKVPAKRTAGQPKRKANTRKR
jgi:hypothetical protein